MSTIKISILGDVCPTDDYRKFWDDKTAFNTVSSLIQNSDLKIVNLECPATNESKPIKKCGPCLKAKPQDVELIKNAGFNLISLANNHVKDFQEQGVLDTIENCMKYDVAFVGAGENAKKASQAYFVEVKGKKIGVISFAEKEFNVATETQAGANYFDVYESPEFVAKCKKECDYLIVLYHGGIEHYRYPSKVLQKKCRLLVRFGANVVICQHSHCVGTYEYYNDGYILYGQGNGVYGYRKNSQAWNEGLLLNIELGESAQISSTLLMANENGIVLADKETTKKRMLQFDNESSKLNDQEFLQREWKSFCAKNGALNRPLFYGKNRVAIKLNRLTKNALFKASMPKKKEMITMNFMRCDALREVVTTLLEMDVYDE